MSSRDPILRHPAEFIIERPEWRSRGGRLRDLSLTGAAWALWSSLWLTLATALGWLGEAAFAWHHMIELDGYQSFFELALGYGGVLALLIALYLGWAGYNYYRFRRSTRRHNRPPVDAWDIAKLQWTTPQQVHNWWAAARLVVWHAPDGRLAEVTVQPQPEEQATAPEPGLSRIITLSNQ
jgi:poly-beta-1,6-N-acetyl-D-glucosamine biosynthesis protein PgaD